MAWSSVDDHAMTADTHFPFEWDAATYGALPLPHARWGAGVADRLGDAGAGRVLDLGCGTGRDAAALLTRWPTASVIGVDASQAMLDAAASTLAPYPGRAELHRADLREPLPLGGPVDAALTVAALHWIPDHRPLFASVAGLLRPGGRFVADAGGHGNLRRLGAAIASVFGPQDDSWNFATAEGTEALLREAGFAHVEVRLRPDPIVLDPATYPAYLATVVLGGHLAGLSRSDAAGAVARVVDAMGEPVVDYVRLEFEAETPS